MVHRLTRFLLVIDSVSPCLGLAFGREKFPSVREISASERVLPGDLHLFWLISRKKSEKDSHISVLKIKRYGTGLTQGCNWHGGSE